MPSVDDHPAQGVVKIHPGATRFVMIKADREVAFADTPDARVTTKLTSLQRASLQVDELVRAEVQ